MDLSHDFRQTVSERIESDPAFAKVLLDEAATLFLNGEPDRARLVLRDLVNATVGFETLARLTDRPSKSLHPMLSSNGNPSMDNLAAIFAALRDRLKVELDSGCPLLLSRRPGRDNRGTSPISHVPYFSRHRPVGTPRIGFRARSAGGPLRAYRAPACPRRAPPGPPRPKRGRGGRPRRRRRSCRHPRPRRG